MPDYRPFLELWPISLQEKRKAEMTGSGTVSSAGTKEHGAVGRIVVRYHFYWAVGCGSLGTSKVKHRLELRINHAHHCFNVLAPFLYGRPALRAMNLGRGCIVARFVRMLVALIGWKWSRVVPLVSGIQLMFKSFHRSRSLVYTSQELRNFINLTYQETKKE